MSSIWGNLAGGAVNGWGYNQLQNDLNNTQDGINDTISGLQDQALTDNQFKPWGVTSSLGNISGGPDGIDYNLSPEQLAQQQQMAQGAMGMFDAASMDPAARQQELYGQLQAQRQPSMDQAYTNLQQNVWGSGTGGMKTANYGGDTQSYAFAKAMNDAAGQDMVNAQGLAQAEQMQQANIGQQMFGNQYQPMANLGQQAQVGLNNQQLAMDQQRHGSNMWTDLALGGLTANTNLENIKGQAFGDQIQAGAGLAQGLGNQWGGAISSGIGGLWDGLFGGNNGLAEIDIGAIQDLYR